LREQLKAAIVAEIQMAQEGLAAFCLPMPENERLVAMCYAQNSCFTMVCNEIHTLFDGADCRARAGR
jgi:hypothetical protein